MGSDKKKGKLHFSYVAHSWDEVIVDYVESGPARKAGVKKGWMLREINDNDITKRDTWEEERIALWRDKIKEEKMVRATFDIPKYHDFISSKDVEALTVGEFTQLIGMDWMELSNNAKAKAK